MAYFQHKDEQQHQRVFQDRQDDDWQEEPRYEYDPEEDWQDDPEDYDELLDEDEMTEEERAMARRDHWQVLAGVGDFLAVIAGTAVILILVALLVSLINWVHADITQSFTLWQTKI